MHRIALQNLPSLLPLLLLAPQIDCIHCRVETAMSKLYLIALVSARVHDLVYTPSGVSRSWLRPYPRQRASASAKRAQIPAA